MEAFPLSGRIIIHSRPSDPGLTPSAWGLEWITHSQMKALVLLEAWDVVESTLTRIVWQMQTHLPNPHEPQTYPYRNGYPLRCLQPSCL